jgi:SAM-dependent methyltransferase
MKPITWLGVDIADSREVSQRTRTDLRFLTYDGINIPLESASVDVVYSHQVLEHVRFPRELLRSVRRVLKPAGYFVGSTSHLEPYHSSSLWNYTAYGLSELLQEAGFSKIELRPGIDGVTLIGRRLLALARIGNLLNPFFEHESILNLGLETLGLARVSVKKRNLLKLVFCGHLVFVAYA